MKDYNEELELLRAAVYADDEESVQNQIFNLGATNIGFKIVPDEIISCILGLLEEEDSALNKVSGHILNYFEFESGSLSDRQKEKILLWLKNHGNKFTSIHGNQVVAELISDEYLRIK